MRDDELRRILADANPWWASAAAGTDPTAWTGAHRTLRDRAGHDLGYRSRVLDDIAHGPPDGTLTVLTGPRRAGKTVVALDTAAHLCAHPEVDPRQVIYVSCDGMAARDLRRLITLGRALARSVDAPAHRRRVWLLDEISGITGWSSVLKAAASQPSTATASSPPNPSSTSTTQSGPSLRPWSPASLAEAGWVLQPATEASLRSDFAGSR
ncbi:AAA family ATPase [Candidatus Frankia alpina]|uniref:AAA family ATPase n=1 Tax=Candidatus Frankia alpina TaxID=2699483 RepID=UPI0013D5BDA6|nr:AAA family ATPase [Candidatus Frankia alpina]